MNIFAIDEDPYISAFELCDQHIVKMPTESIQILVSALLISGAEQDKMPLTKSGKYHRGGYRNHPASIWAAESYVNFSWLCEHTYGLLLEYGRRYSKIHFASEQLDSILKLDIKEYIPDTGNLFPTEFVRCFNQSQGRNLDLLDFEKWPCDHEAYREFYRREKNDFAKWNKTKERPKWMDSV